MEKHSEQERQMIENNKQDIRVMVVEDETITAENIKIVLESSGYTPLPLVTSGVDAVASALEAPPDIILMDIMLEGNIDGIEAARQIHTSANIPVIYLTSYSDSQTLERAKIAEPYGYILKPFNDYDLVNAIEMALYKHSIQEKIRWEKEINSKLALLSQSLLQFPSIDDISANVLKQAQVLTGSQYGFVGYIDPKNGSLVCPTMTRDIWNQCQVEGRSFVFKHFKGLWGWVLEKQEPVISNTPKNDQRSTGTPRGHVPIRNFIGAPALVEGKTVGMVGLANREGDYGEDQVAVIQRMATVYALALHQRQTEDQLLKLSAAVEQSPAIFLITDIEGSIEYVNPAFSQLTGYSREEIKDKTPRIMKSGKMDPDIYDKLWQTVAAGNPWKGELFNSKKNGETYWEDASISPIKNRDGLITHFVKVSADISEKKRIMEDLESYKENLEELVKERTMELQTANKKLRKEIDVRQKAEKKLEESRIRYRDLFEHSPVGIYKCKPDGQIVMANSAFINMMGYPSFDDLAEATRREQWFSTDFPRSRFKDKLEKDGQVKGLEDRWLTRDKRIIAVRENARVTRDDKGNLLYYDGTVEDITMEKEAEEKAILQEQHLRHADKMIALGTLVSGVAHEINNPNNFVMMNAPLLSDMWQGIVPILEGYYRENGDFTIEGLSYTELKASVPHLFNGILDGAKRIKNIVKELKDFARREEDDILQDVDINTVAKSAAALMMPMIKKTTDRFSVNYGKNIPSFKGRIQQLEQVIINLIQNSCQALSHKEKKISISTKYDKRAGTVVVKVSDEGKGIASNHLKDITDPFYTTKRDIGGTGLGLSISENIINQHQGSLSFESRLGKGTTVTVTLPAKTHDNTK